MGLLVSVFPEENFKMDFDGKNRVLTISYLAKAGPEKKPYVISVVLPELDDPMVSRRDTTDAMTIDIGEDGYTPAISITVFESHSSEPELIRAEVSRITSKLQIHYLSLIEKRALSLAVEELEKLSKKEKDRKKKTLLTVAVQRLKEVIG